MRSDRQGHGPLSVYADGSVATSRMKPSGSYNAALHRIDLKCLLRGFRSGYDNRNRTLELVERGGVLFEAFDSINLAGIRRRAQQMRCGLPHGHVMRVLLSQELTGA